jgi:hypothetical protein
VQERPGTAKKTFPLAGTRSLIEKYFVKRKTTYWSRLQELGVLQDASMFESFPAEDRLVQSGKSPNK